jgi:hypothetical protein
MNHSNPLKPIAAIVCAAVLLIGGLIAAYNTVGHNDDQNYQVHQSVGGEITIIDGPGYYGTFFPSVWTYPRAIEKYWTADDRPESVGDESIRCTFNDSGKAQVSTYVKIQLPTNEDQRRLLHRETQGNPKNILNLVQAHLTNCVKVTGPMMSATEHQTSRKGEFTQLLYDQLRNGLYQTRVVERESFETFGTEEITAADGSKSIEDKKVKVLVNEIVRNKDGKPIILEESPLDRYGITVVQFSVTDTDYDADTEKQFAARKAAILATEQAKALKAQQVQERLMIEEKGKRELAEVTAEMNKDKERATIAADKEAEVAKIAKEMAVTKASQLTEVAEQRRQEALKLKDIAKIESETAELNKKATISAAEARKEEIAIGGGLSERDRILAEIAASRDAKVAEALSKVNVPSTVIVGGGDKDGTGANMSNVLMNLFLLERAGIKPANNK